MDSQIAIVHHDNQHTDVDQFWQVDLIVQFIANVVIMTLLPVGLLVEFMMNNLTMTNSSVVLLE